MHKPAPLASLLLFAAFATPALATPTPASGTVTPAQTAPTAWNGNLLVGPNPVSNESLCQENVNCEEYVLTVSGTPADWAGKVARIELSYLSATAEEYDIYVYKDVLHGYLVDSDASTGTNDKKVMIDPSDPNVGTGTFVIRVSGSVSIAADQYKAKAYPIPKPAGAVPAVQASGIAPSFQIHNPDPTFAPGDGEPSIGVNPFSGKIFYLSGLQTLRATPNDSCRNTPSMTWEDVSAPTTSKTGLDPILFTDLRTGRTLVSQLSGANSLSAYTDDDGKTWIPSQGGGIVSGIDHQTVGMGPFHAPLPSGAVYSDAVYYCTQADAEANCAMSLNGGLTFGPAVPIYTLLQCTNLHGHVKVGPDGTAYVPNEDCSGVGSGGQGVSVSEDNGLTWTVYNVANTQKGSTDPSVAVDRGGRLYIGMASGDRMPVVGISDDHGRNFTKLVDVGASLGVRAVEFPTMTAGDRGRAAFMFLGSTTPGSSAGIQSLTFPGVWHLYVAVTYDGGDTWFTQDATPNDAVQRHGIWNQGGSYAQRNLLDFNDLTIDGHGNLVAAFADGCFEAACTQATGIGNGYTARVSILRQVAGRSLYGIYDPPAQSEAPGAPQLKALRNGYLAYLSWNQSGNGGSPVTSYTVTRNGATIGTAAGTAASFVDDTVDPSATYTYAVKATNAAGTSCGDNSVTSPPSGGTCLAGGTTVGTFAPGLQTGAPANPSMDIRSMSVAEPPFADGVERLVLSMKVADLSTLPPDGTWRITWTSPSSSSAAWYVGMQTDAQGHATYDYGQFGVTSAVVVGLGNYVAQGTPDQGTWSPDGTITITVRKDVVGSPQPGDLLASFTGKSYLATGSVSREPLDVATGGAYLVMGNAYCAPATTTVIEDDDARILYSTGWHQIASSNASAGHFHLSQQGKTASLSFGVPARQYGALTFGYGKSDRGGTAEVFLDGVSQGLLSFGGGAGSPLSPQFGFTARYAGLKPGSHSFQLVRRSGGEINVDGFVLESSYSNANPPTGLGPTKTSANAAAAPGSTSSFTWTAPAGSEVASILAQSSLPVPLNIVVLDLAGNVVGSSNGSDGSASLVVPAAAGTQLVVQAINAGTALADVALSVTPTVAR